MQIPWLNFLYLIYTIFVPSLFCCFWQIISNCRILSIVSYIEMKLRCIILFRCTFCSVQTLTLDRLALHICTEIRLKTCNTLYHIYLNICTPLACYIFYFSALRAFVDTYSLIWKTILYCIYIYIYMLIITILIITITIIIIYPAGHIPKIPYIHQ